MSQTVHEKYLNFLKNNFNTKKATMADYNEYVKLLDAASKDTQDIVSKRKAQELWMKLKPNKQILDIDNIDDLFIKASSSDSTETVYKAIDDLIVDIKNARKWLDNYEDFVNSLRAAPYKGMVHDKIVALGKAIYGRSIELCPIDTGTLRDSAVLRVGSNWFEIEYTAPYAAYVHDNALAWHKPGTTYKFLENAAQEFLGDAEVVWVDVLGESKILLHVAVVAGEIASVIHHYGYNG